MPGSVTPVSVLGSQADGQRQRIRLNFEASVSARETIRGVCELADTSVQRVFSELLQVHSNSCQGLSLLALGGYGRRLLFPYSDLDILFLFENDKAEREFRPLIADFSRTLWDMGFRVSPAGRTVEESKHIEEDNAEFHLALLDRRFLAGDAALFEKLDRRVLPALQTQARPFLFAQLHKLTRERLARYGNTIFHLEPNVKESPGGLRDYQAAVWLRGILDESKECLTNSLSEEDQASQAMEFLSSIRCFLHYRNQRNDNTLSYELQAAAAERALGVSGPVPADAAEWMRTYFRHARTLNRMLLRYLEHKATMPLSLRQRLFRLAHRAPAPPSTDKPFAVREGLLEVLEIRAFPDRLSIFNLFAEAARTGTPLSRRAERSISFVLQHPERPSPSNQVSWPALREILAGDYPGVALRAMQRLGLLTEILPEFGWIDSLVVRDFYHRYTVDEHSLRAIEHLQQLAESPDSRGVHFQPLWKAVDRRDLLILALLLHDVGKGRPVDNHVIGSLEALQQVAERLQLSPEEKAEVHFLIEHHLDMSATVQRRDIFDQATISAFATAVANEERLQCLCLMTYADIHAVNPEALTPWKAEMLWQLFVATSNYFSRTLDRDRLHVRDERSMLEEVRAHAKGARIQDIERFLEGFPRRYLAVHSPAEIAGHFALYQKLRTEPAQAEVRVARHGFSLALLTADRPRLFAAIAGVLAGWGMNIIKADAFANAAGIVLDTFYFTDLHHTFELNPDEIERFRSSLLEVVNGRAHLEPLLKGRESASLARPLKIPVETRTTFDDSASEHSTLLEIMAQDRPGLLYDIGSAMARLSCNIEVALIDTEGQKVIDVFYLTEEGRKLSAEKQEQLRSALQAALA
jgi:[protein-PII] uridylyltransferase